MDASFLLLAVAGIAGGLPTIWTLVASGVSGEVVQRVAPGLAPVSCTWRWGGLTINPLRRGQAGQHLGVPPRGRHWLRERRAGRAVSPGLTNHPLVAACVRAPALLRQGLRMRVPPYQSSKARRLR